MMEADILLFMGQSNMAGRGDDQLAPKVLPGAAWEYRAVTEPDRLVPLVEPFGVNENREGGVWEPGMKTGSMVAAFVNACYRKTGRPVIAVSCSKGGSSIREWQLYCQTSMTKIRLVRLMSSGSLCTSKIHYKTEVRYP